jgi:hypothetical protein
MPGAVPEVSPRTGQLPTLLAELPPLMYNACIVAALLVVRSTYR